LDTKYQGETFGIRVSLLFIFSKKQFQHKIAFSHARILVLNLLYPGTPPPAFAQPIVVDITMGGLYATQTRGKWTVFVVTFISYMAYRSGRKAFSNIKANISAPHCGAATSSLVKVNDAYVCCFDPSTTVVHAAAVMSITPHVDADIISADALCPNVGVQRAACSMDTDKLDALPACGSWFGSETETVQKLALMDTLFMIAYAIGLFVAGYIEDRVNKRHALVVGMTVSGILTAGVGALGWMQVHDSLPWLLVWTANGLVQASGWPATVAVMGNWFDKTERGALLGLWSGCSSVGNIVGANIVVWALASTDKVPGTLAHGDWRVAIAATGILLITSALVVGAALENHPLDCGLEDPNAEVEIAGPSEDSEAAAGACLEEGLLAGVTDASISSSVPARNERKAITFLGAWRIPNVTTYALAYSATKIVDFCLLFWLPLMLSDVVYTDAGSGTTESLGSGAQADALSQLYDWGSFLGVWIAGAWSDRLGLQMSWRAPPRGLVIAVMMLPAAPLLMFLLDLRGPALAACIGAIGALVGGPAQLMGSSVAADLALSPALVGSTEALATVTGIIDGTGALFAALAQFAVALLLEYGGWNAVFVMLVTACLATVLCISKIVANDVLDLLRGQRKQ
jgi:sugar phosphate permease